MERSNSSSLSEGMSKHSSSRDTETRCEGPTLEAGEKRESYLLRAQVESELSQKAVVPPVHLLL